MKNPGFYMNWQCCDVTVKNTIMLILLLFQKTKWVLSKSFTDNQAQNVQTHSKKENMSLETNFPQFLHFYSEKM